MKSHPHQSRTVRHDLAPRTDSVARTDSGARADSGGRHGRSKAAANTRPAPRPCRMSRRTLALADLKLAQIEDAFLDMLLDAHPRRTTALDRLLNDLAAADPADAPALAGAGLPGLDADVAAASARRIESALLGAVIQRHPRRDRSLDRLLSDIDLAPCAPDAAHGAWVDEEERQHAEFDVCCDNDFDGLG